MADHPRSRNSISGRRPLAGPFSRDETIVNLDRRSHCGRMFRDLTESLHQQLGDSPTPAQRLIVQSAAVKAVRMSLASEQIMAMESSVADIDREWLAWSNSLKQDLQALGLKAVATEKPLTLEQYVQHKNGAATQAAD
jgi:hypothetical protein